MFKLSGKKFTRITGFRPHLKRTVTPGLRFARMARFTSARADNILGFQPSENRQTAAR
jgi:hypothetical protein